MEVSSIPVWAALVLGVGLLVRLAVGGSITLRAFRIGGVSERVIGGFVLLQAVGELAAVVATRLRGGPAEDWVPFLAVVTLATTVTALVLLAEGLRRLFRPRLRVLRPMVAVLALGLCCTAGWRWAHGGGGVVVAQRSLPNVVLIATMVALDLWWLGESFAVASRLRRQAALGLGSMESVWRFRLWGLAASAHASMGASLLACALVFGRPAVEFPALLACLGLAGIVCALAIHFSFRLPRALRSETEEPTPEPAALA